MFATARYAALIVSLFITNRRGTQYPVTQRGLCPNCFSHGELASGDPELLDQVVGREFFDDPGKRPFLG